MSFRNKLTLSITALLIMILVFIIIISYRTFLQVSVENERDFLIQRGMSIAKRHVTLSENEWLNSLSLHVPDGGFIRLIDDHEETMMITQDPDSKLDPDKVPADDEGHPESQLYTINDTKVLVVRVPLSRADETTIEIAEPLSDLQKSINLLLLILISVSVIAVVILFFMSKFFSWLLLRPISKLIRTMKEIETSLIFQQVPMKRMPKDELYQLTVTFNRMMQRIQESYIKQKQFVSDASHELRTPLTILEGYANMLRRWGYTDEEQGRKAAETVYQETVRMRKLTEQLLELASSEEQSKLILEPVELVAFTEQTAQLFQNGSGRQVRVHSEPRQIEARIDALRFKQVLVILLDNALKYSKDAIDVLLERDPDKSLIQIIIRDYGQGIPKQDLEHVFERFYRVDVSRQRKTGGAGLGLSIARNIVLLHQGKIDIQSEEGKGTDVMIRLPDNL